MGSEPESPAARILAQQPEQREELAPAARWWDRPLVVLDTETTAADPLKARIVQAACSAIYPDGRLSSSSYCQIVNVEGEIPDDVVAVHGISKATAVRDGLPLVDVLYEVLRRIDRWHKVAAVVIFNAVYDWPLVWEEVGRTELVWTDPLAAALLVDPLVIEREFNGVAKGHFSNKLADVAKRYGIAVKDAHSAQGDAIMTAAILRVQLEKYEILRKVTLEELQALQREWYARWRDNLNAYNAKKGKAWRVSGEWPFGDRRRQL